MSSTQFLGRGLILMAVLSSTLRADSSFTRRAWMLTGVFVLAGVLILAVNAPQPEAQPRYPTADAVYAIDGWSVGPSRVDGRAGVVFVSRGYHSADGSQLELVLTTSPQAKLVYRAGADVPLLGSGYAVEEAPAALVAPRPDRTAQIARRGGETWLQIASFGERRGGLGNGLLGWAAAIFDMVQGRSNDYYLVRVLTPSDTPASAARASQLADTLFPRIAAEFAAY